MNLNDRRLLIELGAVLAAKLAIIFWLKVQFFTPRDHDLPSPIYVGELAAPAATRDKDTAAARGVTADKER